MEQEIHFAGNFNTEHHRLKTYRPPVRNIRQELSSPPQHSLGIVSYGSHCTHKGDVSCWLRVLVKHYIQSSYSMGVTN